MCFGMCIVDVAFKFLGVKVCYFNLSVLYLMYLVHAVRLSKTKTSTQNKILFCLLTDNGICLIMQGIGGDLTWASVL